MKSSSASPDVVRMSRCSAAIEARLPATSSVTMAGSVSIGAGGPPAGGAPGGPPPGPWSGGDGRKSPRSTMLCSASPMSGSDVPRASRSPARVAGEARPWVTSTKSLPAASCIGGSAVSWNSESPRGFMGSVIICW